MELALSTTRRSSCKAVQCLLPGRNQHLFAGHLKTTNLVPLRHPPSRFTLAFSRRRNRDPVIRSSSSKKNKKTMPQKDDVVDDDDDDDDDFEGDPFEALFSMLEEDLENDDLTVVDDDEINEEDTDKLARELEEALEDDMEMFNMAKNDIEIDQDEAQEEEEEEEEERQVRLKNWQLRKLAYALKIGRRKTSIKNLAAELCLDRAVVLEMLRDPPPNLLMMSVALPDEPPPTVVFPEVKPMDAVKEEATTDAVEHDTKVKEPVHARQHRWFAQKRLKKVQVETLEMVYRRSKRPTNAMISSIVHVTNLPRRRIVQWFEDKRAEEGVPDRRGPYQRPNPETVFSS